MRYTFPVTETFAERNQNTTVTEGVLDVVEKMRKMKPDEIVLARTLKVGVPSQVRELVGSVSGGTR